MEELLDEPIEPNQSDAYFKRSKRIGNIAGIIVLVAVLILVIAGVSTTAKLDSMYLASLLAGFGFVFASIISINASYLGIMSLIKKEQAPNYRYVLLFFYILMGSFIFIVVGTNIADAF